MKVKTRGQVDVETIVGDAIGKGGKIARAAIKHGDEALEVASCSSVTIKLPLANC